MPRASAYDNRWRNVLLLCAIPSLLLAACAPRELSPKPTPYVLPVPAFAVDTAHAPNIPLDNPTTLEGVELGRRLFYETALSGDGTLSCASCHQQAHAFSDPRVFTGAFGTPRNSMPLVGLAFHHYFFWDGRALSLELQAFEPVRAHQEMNTDWPTVCARLQRMRPYPQLFRRAFGTDRVDSMRVAFALAQFERTLLSFNSPFDRFRYGGDAKALTPEQQRGWQLFIGKGHCADCHMPPHFTDERMVNIGLDAEPADKGLGQRTGIPWHMGRFKTPSLRNVAVTAPYMHDGRFATLEEVLDFYATGVHTAAPTLDPHMEPWLRNEVFLSPVERAQLLAFLHALTDTAFLTDPAFAAPAHNTQLRTR